MNIFINTPQYTIEDPKDGDTYYFDTQRYPITAILANPLDKVRISLCLLFENANSVTFETSRGNYILDKDVRELTMIYNNGWYSVGDRNVIPYIDNSFKQEIILNLYNLSRTGENLIINYDRGSTNVDGKYKMSNLIFIGSCNYHSRITSYDGQGAVLVYKQSNGRIYGETIITEGYDSRNGNYQGSFGKHVKLVDMGGYDLLVVSAPSKVRDNISYSSVLDDVFGYIYIYSYRKNSSDEFYFHRETKISLPSLRITKDFTQELIDDYLPFNTIFQIEPLKNTGIIVSYKSKILYFYDLRNMFKIAESINQSLQPEFIRIFDSDIYLSYETEIKKISYSSNIWNDPISTILTNSYNVNNFGRIVYPYDEGMVVISEKDFFDFDLNYQLKKRITFTPGILSFDLFSNGNIRKYFILIDGTNNNLYVLDKEYNILLNDLFKEYRDDIARLIRTDSSGETLYICLPNHNDVENVITDVGLVANYDLFFERENKTLSSLFPDFDIFNQVLVEEKTLNNNKHFYLEETFANSLLLISNRSNNKKNIEKIYPVIDDTGIVMELNYDVSNSSFLSRYSKYFIYSDPTSGDKEYSYILNSSNRYLGWNDNQILSYNNSSVYEIHSFKKNNKINLVLLGVGTIGSTKRWNIIESEMKEDPSENHYDISMNFNGHLDMLQFISFHKFVHNNDLLFIIHNRRSIIIVDYFSRTIHNKSFNRDTSNDLFYIDSFKNLFHLYPIEINNTTHFYLTIYKSGDYQSIVLDSVKTDIAERPYQIVGQYYDGAFVFLENYDYENGVIVVRRFDIIQELAEKIEFEELNISNEFQTDKHVVDVEFFQDTIKKLILVNKSEKEDKIFQKKSQKIYTLPRLLKTKYQSFVKKDVRQLMVREKKYVNYEQYQINDDVPNVFFNIKFQKYFKNRIGIYANYEFFDDKDRIEFDQDKTLILVKQNDRSFSRYTFRPDPNYELQTFVYTKDDEKVTVTAKGLTGSRSYIEIFDISGSNYEIKENGEATGISIRKKSFEYDICYETLDDRDGIYISEEYDEMNQRITYWTFSKSNNYLDVSHHIPLTFQINKNACFYRGYNDEFIMNILDGNNVVYFQKTGGVYIKRTIQIPNGLKIEEPFDVHVLSQEFFIIKSSKSYLFVKNNNPNVNSWRYFAEQIHRLDTNHEDTFELERHYFVDTDVSNNYLELLQNTNINIKSPIFYDRDERFYCIQDNKIFKIDHPNLSNLLDIHTISSDGSTIYTQSNNDVSKNLIYFDHANQIIERQTVLTPQFCPDLYTSNMSSQISTNGHFTLTNSNLGCSKQFLFQPTKSRQFNTIYFPLVDISDTVYFYEPPILTKYKLNSNQYVLDSSNNLTNFEIPIDSDETFFTNSKFDSLTYKEITFNTKTQFLNSFVQDIPIQMSISPDGEEFLAYQTHTIHLFKESIVDYPNKFILQKSIVPSNQLKNNLTSTESGSSFKVDWRNHRIFNGYGALTTSGITGSTGGTGASGSNISKVSIISWDPNLEEYHHHSDICGNFSFGFKIELSKDGQTLFVTEPNAPETNEFKEGKIHIYKYDILTDRFILVKTLRSRRSRIGYLMKVSPSMNKIVTYGYQRGVEQLDLVIFYDLDTEPKEVSVKSSVYDMTFLGDTDVLFVEENFFVQDSENGQRTFYLLEEVNGCPNIFTKVVLPNILFSNNQMMFTLTSFGDNYILFDGLNMSHIIQIKDYMMKYIATQVRPDNSKVLISEQGNTTIVSEQTSGRFMFMISW